MNSENHEDTPPEETPEKTAEPLTPETLASTEDWHDFYVERGEEMLALARLCLISTDTALIERGLEIVEGAFSEEDAENPDTPTSLSGISFAPLVEPLRDLLVQEPFAKRALYGLWVCSREGASPDVSQEELAPFLDKKGSGKDKIHGMTMRSVAFRVFIHSAYGHGKGDEVAEMVKKNRDLENSLFDELETDAGKEYNIESFAEAVFEKVRKFEPGNDKTIPTTAIETLWKLLEAGVDISEIIPLLAEHQERLAQSTDAMTVIAGHYLKTAQYDRLEEWLADTDKRAAARAYRGVMQAHKRGESACAFAKSPGIIDKLAAVATQNGLRQPGEYLADCA